MGRRFLYTALLMLCFGLCFGLLGVISYIFPDFLKDKLNFSTLRPLHVSSVLFWILLGASGVVYFALDNLTPGRMSKKLALIQWGFWLMAIAGIFGSYFAGYFGGREYWEFPPYWALSLLLAWILFLINLIRAFRGLHNWPVYVWMWCTGSTFFLFIFLENYLWLIPNFRNNLVADMTIQWKVNGSMVGAWNQLLYGTMFFLMDRISGNTKVARSKMAFFMYFLGLFNLMFNWGHHIYTLPTQSYVKYVGYTVSMTEWIILIRILYNWRKSLEDAKRISHLFPYRFLLAADFWVLVNLTQAIFMSIPAINLYTHGTHITVAHAMGTTIGINSMILLGACFSFLLPESVRDDRKQYWLNLAFWLLQGSLFLFWLSLILAGVIKGIWQHELVQGPYSKLMDELKFYFIVVFISGCGMTAAFFYYTFTLFNSYKKSKPLV